MKSKTNPSQSQHNKTKHSLNNNNNNNDYNDDTSDTSSENESDILVKILCNRKVCTRIFALIIEIIDSLLEDWYPDLGTRFMQDSKGDYLVTRLAPCVDCIKNTRLNTINSLSTAKQEATTSTSQQHQSDLFMDTFSTNANDSLHKDEPKNEANTWNYLDIDDKFKIATVLADNVSLIIDPSDLGGESTSSEKKRLASIASTLTTNSNESGQSYIKYENYDDEEKLKLKLFESTNWIYCFMLDDVCYSVLRNFVLSCPKHGVQLARVVAPDIAFEDIDDKFLVSNENLKIEALLGRGSFGSVFCGSLMFKVSILVN